jgi:hypothetical protein
LSDKALDVADSSGLTDDNWSEVGKLQQAYKTGGERALKKAMDVLLDKDPVRFIVVVGAFFPNVVREAMKDAMAEAGITDEDLQDLERELESPTPDQ